MLSQIFSGYAWLHNAQQMLRQTRPWTEAVESMLTNFAEASSSNGKATNLPGLTAKVMAATYKQWNFLNQDFEDPGFQLNDTVIDGENVAVTEETVSEKPFCKLTHFKRDKAARQDPKLLIFAPLSGHNASLLRGTVKNFLPDHDVYITSWKNAAQVSLEESEAFGLDNYIEYAKDYIYELGADTHVLAVCQATIPVVSAVSKIAEETPNDQPASLTLIAGPGDVRRASCPVTEFAENNKLENILANMCDTVPSGLPGAGRKVVPGHNMLTAFVSMNPMSHFDSYQAAWRADISGDHAKATKTYDFYKDYNAVLDLDARFYEQTVQWVFQEARLARGLMEVDGRTVAPEMITVPQLAVEGGKDEISPPGHTLAYLEMMGGGSADKYHILNENVGHYGAFTGSKFAKEIAPCIKAHIRQAGDKAGYKYDSLPEASIRMPELWDGKCPPPRAGTPGSVGVPPISCAENLRLD